MLFLFGYIRPLKSQLKFCEYDIYKAVYCGLCKEIGKSYSFILRFTLSYDFAFLGLLGFSLSDSEISIKPQPCIAHPLKKTPCIACGGLNYSASAAVISVYHKLKDDTIDSGFFRKIFSYVMLGFIKRSYNKAAKTFPVLSSAAEKYMAVQRETEKENTKSIDKAAEPTSQIMSEIAAGLSDDENTKRILSRIGYLLGRYVYITDALDDVKKDYKRKRYNPLLLQDGCENLNIEKIREIAKDSIYFTLGELANAYTLLNIKKFKPILDNIIYLGLGNTFNLVLNERELLK